MNKIVLSVIIAGLASLPAMGSIVLDGDTSDWPAAYKFTDPVDNEGKMDIVAWGACVQGDTLFVFQTITGSFANAIPPVVKSSGPWLDVWIDIDNNPATSLGGSTPLANIVGWAGADISPEFQYRRSGLSTPGWGVRYYGQDNNWEGYSGTYAVPTQAMSSDGHTMEYSFPLATVFAKLAEFGTGVTPVMTQWTISARIDGYLSGADGGPDYTSPQVISVPEPATVAFLALAGLGLIRRRK